jgi:hypothetical protein
LPLGAAYNNTLLAGEVPWSMMRKEPGTSVKFQWVGSSRAQLQPAAKVPSKSSRNEIAGSGTGVAVGGTGTGVSVGTGVLVGSEVGVSVGSGVSVGTGVPVGFGVGVSVGTGVSVGFGVGVSVGCADCVAAIAACRVASTLGVGVLAQATNNKFVKVRRIRNRFIVLISFLSV